MLVLIQVLVHPAVCQWGAALHDPAALSHSRSPIFDETPYTLTCPQQLSLPLTLKYLMRHSALWQVSSSVLSHSNIWWHNLYLDMIAAAISLSPSFSNLWWNTLYLDMLPAAPSHSHSQIFDDTTCTLINPFLHSLMGSVLSIGWLNFREWLLSSLS